MKKMNVDHFKAELPNRGNNAYGAADDKEDKNIDDDDDGGSSFSKLGSFV